MADSSNSSQTSVACCAYTNLSLARLLPGGELPLHCQRIPEPEDLWNIFQDKGENDSGAGFDHWYNECFEPMEPPPITWAELLPSLTVYSLTFALGVLGNLLIILTVMQRSSPTNTFLASLASTDLLLILICTPVKLYRLFAFTWHLGETVCKVTFYIQDLSVICSVLNLTAMSMERFYAIVYPLQSRRVCTVSQARRLVAATWGLASILALPRNWIQVHYQIGNEKDGFYFWCIPNWEERGMWQAFQVYMLIIVVVVPTIVMTLAYTAISKEVLSISHSGVQGMEQERYPASSRAGSERQTTEFQFGSEGTTGVVERSTSPNTTTTLPTARKSRFSSLRLHQSFRSSKQAGRPPAQPAPAPVQLRANYSRGRGASTRSSGRKTEGPDRGAREKAQIRKVVPMLAMLVIVFILCWSPILIFEVLQSFDILHWWITGGLKHSKTCFSLLAYFNSCINPFIYGFMSRNFRVSLSKALCHCSLGERMERSRTLHRGNSKPDSISYLDI